MLRFVQLFYLVRSHLGPILWARACFPGSCAFLRDHPARPRSPAPRQLNTTGSGGSMGAGAQLLTSFLRSPQLCPARPVISAGAGPGIRTPPDEGDAESARSDLQRLGTWPGRRRNSDAGLASVQMRYGNASQNKAQGFSAEKGELEWRACNQPLQSQAHCPECATDSLLGKYVM